VTRLTRKVTAYYLVIVRFFTTRDLDGSGSEVFPDERVLLGFEERSNVCCPFRLGVQHAFVILAREVLDDSCESFRTNLVSQQAEAAVCLWDENVRILISLSSLRFGIVTGMTTASSACRRYWRGE